MFRKKRSDNQRIRTSANIDNTFLYEEKTNAEILSTIDELLDISIEDMDTDKIEQYIALLQDKAPVMQGYDPDAQWEKIEDQHPMLFLNEETSHSKEFENMTNRITGRWRLFRFAEIACITVLCLVVTANAFGIKPIEAIISWAEGIIQIYSNPSGVMELPEEDPHEYHSLATALEENGIDSVYIPTWIPNDYSISDVTVREADYIIKCSAIYESERGELLIRVVHHSMDDTSYIEEREEGGNVYHRNNIDYYIVSDLGWYKAGWQIGSNSYVISGQISEEELVDMIESIT